jgi:hypothetical protein
MARLLLATAGNHFGTIISITTATAPPTAIAMIASFERDGRLLTTALCIKTSGFNCVQLRASKTTIYKTCDSD